MYGSAVRHWRDAMEIDTSGPDGLEKAELADENYQVAVLHASLANTAALVLLAGIQADAHGVRAYELDAWDKVIPMTPMTQCKHKEARRPQCAERHTEDCPYADPVPEPKHELLKVGTRVLVHDLVYDEETHRPRKSNPEAGRISGYAAGKSKYRWQYEHSLGHYSSHESFTFADNRVEVHPDGPECPPAPQPVKREPTGPRIYVRNRRGKQGYVVETGKEHDDAPVRVLVQWFSPGANPVWRQVADLEIIAAEDVDRCPNGQARDECEEGENRCELCLEAEDAVAEAIEASMGQR
jgi:hypothetical protein